jgi:hypothetical protein
MEIQCNCGKFRAELSQFPKNTPGRLKCYCDDCQAFLHYLKRADLLDENGGSEIIPYYPVDIKFTAGSDLISCVRLLPKGMYRFSTTCCNSPIANTAPKRPWVGVHRSMFTTSDPDILVKTLGPVKSSIMGKYAKGTPPPGTPQKFDLNGFATVIPYIFKGMIFGKAKHSPFFENEHAVVPPKVLTSDELLAVREIAKT